VNLDQERTLEGMIDLFCLQENYSFNLQSGSKLLSQRYLIDTSDMIDKYDCKWCLDKIIDTDVTIVDRKMIVYRSI